MNVIKQYDTAKKQKGNVSFGSIRGGRWAFRCSDKESGPIEKIIRVPGGLAIAEKIAEVIGKSWKRTAGKGKEAPDRLDTACRNAIDKLCQIRTLKDWDGKTEWWSNATVEGADAMPMNFIKQQKSAGVSAEDLAQDMALEHATEAAVESEEPAAEVLHEAFAQAEPAFA